MTETQETQEIIDDLKEGITAAEKVVALLEKQQKAVVPEFDVAGRFYACRDNDSGRTEFTLGLYGASKWSGLPSGFLGRACFDRDDIRDIINGLQSLIGDNQ